MSWIILVGVAGTAILALWYWMAPRSRRLAAEPPRRMTPQQSRTPQQQLQTLKEMGKFTGVQITRCGCTASSRLAGKKFPIEEAPRLPLHGCEADRCTCQYVGLLDRRTGIDRRTELQLRGAGQGSEERRAVRDRRKRGKDVWERYDGL